MGNSNSSPNTKSKNVDSIPKWETGMWIYVLKLTDGKYYVGKSSNLELRIKSHFNGSSNCAWTNLHRPVEVVEIIASTNPHDENNVTINYINRMGMDNVRGGQYATVKLSQGDKDAILKTITSLNDQCHYCSEYGHFAKDCNRKQQNEDSSSVVLSKHPYVCKRCQRQGHNTRQCFAITMADGSPLAATDASVYVICTKCGRNNHTTTRCYARFHVNRSKL